MQKTEQGIHINFAYRTFVWSSEASEKANVHCVIIGFSNRERQQKLLYDGDNAQIVGHITPYLSDKEEVIVKSSSTPLCEDVPKMIYGNIPRDGGFFTFDTQEEIEDFLKNEPNARQYIHKFIGAKEFINRIDRWFLFIEDCEPSELTKMQSVMKRIEKVREFRLSSKEIQKFAATPSKLAQHTQPIGVDFIAVPIVSSSKRRYVPIGYVDGNVITNNQIQIIPHADLYHFGILSSNVHNAWMRKTCGRLKSDYRYSKDMVYNTFPWPNNISQEAKAKIIESAQNIIDVRNQFPNSTLADLYNPLTMPEQLQKAHAANDKAVMQAYGFTKIGEDGKKHWMNEAEVVAELMKMYQELTEAQ